MRSEQFLNNSISERLQLDITEKVSALYEAFPYPNYPLLAKPKVIDGYLANSRFADRLRSNLFASAFKNLENQVVTDSPLQSSNILILGCGEILPYVIRKIEPRKNHITSVDVSSKSLTRAKIRNLLSTSSRNSSYINIDIDSFLDDAKSSKKQFDHIDAYGVLHHLANPTRVLIKISKIMPDHGTARIMVYNSQSRGWIHHIQRAFSLLKLSPFNRSDLTIARDIISNLAEISPTIKERVGGMGKSLIDSDTRFVDAFFHAREARISISQWFNGFDRAGLVPIGLFDRYGELDDLQNPLWVMPSCEELIERVEDGRFENNLEVYLAKKNSRYNEKKLIKNDLKTAFGTDDFNWSIDQTESYEKKPGLKYRMAGLRYPMKWSSFHETSDTRPALLSKLWLLHKKCLKNRSMDHFDELLLREFSFPALQRLARIGGLLPSMIQSAELQLEINKPIHATMEVPDRIINPKNIGHVIKVHLQNHAKISGICSKKTVAQAVKRLLQATV